MEEGVWPKNPHLDPQVDEDELTIEDFSFMKPKKPPNISPAQHAELPRTNMRVKSTRDLLHFFFVLGGVVAATCLGMSLVVLGRKLAPENMLKWNQEENQSLVARQQKLSAVMPSNYLHFLDMNEEQERNKSGVAVIWDIPGDGDVLQHILSTCVGLVAAGGAISDTRQTQAVDEPLDVFEKNNNRYVNCFTGHQAGIERIKKTNMISSGLVDVIYAPLIYEIGETFTEDHPAKMVAMFHDPVQRVASVFRIVKTIIPKFGNSSLEDFFQTLTGANNNNWMTRELSNCGLSDLNDECLRAAKEVVRQKCFVGMTSDLDRSLDMIYQIMGWDSGGSDFNSCSNKFKNGNGLDRLYTNLVEPGTAEYDLIVRHNSYDIELYQTAKEVYESYW